MSCERGYEAREEDQESRSESGQSTTSADEDEAREACGVRSGTTATCRIADWARYASRRESERERGSPWPPPASSLGTQPALPPPLVPITAASALPTRYLTRPFDSHRHQAPHLWYVVFCPVALWVLRARVEWADPALTSPPRLTPCRATEQPLRGHYRTIRPTRALDRPRATCLGACSVIPSGLVPPSRDRPAAASSPAIDPPSRLA